MHRTLNLDNQEIFDRIKELSNITKFRIMELIQNKKLSITMLSKKVNLAFNKCSNYCSDLKNKGLVKKEKLGKNVFVKSKLNLQRLSSVIS